jgi:hypothetical protein
MAVTVELPLRCDFYYRQMLGRQPGAVLGHPENRDGFADWSIFHETS